MRRPLMPLLAAPLLLLAACDSGGEVVEPSADSTQAPQDDAATTSGGDDAARSAPPDDAAVTSEGPSDGVEGGEDGQAAADRAKEFLLALVDADPAACSLMLSFSDTTVPMSEVPEDLELCEEQLPETMSAAVQAQGLGEEGRDILEAMQIDGAAVDGDTAVIDQDNYSDLFAESMGDSTITLVKVDGEWFVDVERFLATP
ncbi:hypothetical protein SGUI_1413 [Serinicoccus hydrothermalis]|uniref:Lipoprotein n=1 Tax=Serinicoccus hydrothermalis TaxID=1758689 RepID=A0A1B1NBI8_9MICO|nr:hypothetical protein [Serinicoccus hydrothermalis]ANS78809.1 hypothetical protein SGUI_1413 [Serinicoccus hydrothermalis]